MKTLTSRKCFVSRVPASNSLKNDRPFDTLYHKNQFIIVSIIMHSNIKVYEKSSSFRKYNIFIYKFELKCQWIPYLTTVWFRNLLSIELHGNRVLFSFQVCNNTKNRHLSWLRSKYECMSNKLPINLMKWWFVVFRS